MKMKYQKIGDYLYPQITMKEQKIPKGKYAQLRLTYLIKNKQGTYTNLLMNNELIPHLQEIQKTATERVEKITQDLARQNQVNEQMKEKNQMQWVQMMNMYKLQAEEQVERELIYN